MPVEEARSEDTPYGRYVTSHGWFVLNLEDALAIRAEGNGGAVYPIEPREARFADFGLNEAYADRPGGYDPERIPWPLDPDAKP